MEEKQIAVAVNQSVAVEVKLEDYFVNYNPHPRNLNVPDCVKRAFTKLLDLDYKVVAKQLNDLRSKTYAQAFNSNSNVLGFLKVNHFKEVNLKKEFPKNWYNLTAKDFALANKQGKYLIRVHRHVIACVDGKLYDSWYSGNKFIKSVYILPDYALAKKAVAPAQVKVAPVASVTPATTTQTHRPAYLVSPIDQRAFEKRGWVLVNVAQDKSEQDVYNELVNQYAQVKLYRLTKGKVLVAYVKGGK